MGIVLITVLMLVASNVFMTFAWYGHLKDLKDKPWLIAAMGFLVGRIVHARCGIFHLPPRGHFAAG